QLAQMAGQASAAQRSLTGLHTALNTEIENWKKPGGGKPPEAIQKTAEELLKKADDACKKFATPNQCGERAAGLGSAGPPLVFTPPPITQRITQLLTGLDSYAAAPTAWQLDQMKLLQTMLTENAAAARKLTQDELAALNKSM